ncbi:hypothetical protein G6F37_010925 [Rhizopus arrhizus]|nr:hypothetical protein G6F38_010988 [Rhizopus arrhizus]KAG1151757.1 hypothetical protein G6F37_010925 [Rhizopus arrhizus]
MQFRRRYLHGSASSNYMPPPTSLAWTKFWAYPVPHACRNVWYRLLHRSIPHRSLLNQPIPYYFPSDTCPVCAASLDILKNSLYGCQKNGSSGKLIPTTTKYARKTLKALEQLANDETSHIENQTQEEATESEVIQSEQEDQKYLLDFLTQDFLILQHLT